MKNLLFLITYGVVNLEQKLRRWIVLVQPQQSRELGEVDRFRKPLTLFLNQRFFGFFLQKPAKFRHSIERDVKIKA